MVSTFYKLELVINFNNTDIACLEKVKLNQTQWNRDLTQLTDMSEANFDWDVSQLTELEQT